MPTKPTITEVAIEYCLRFPLASTRSIARMLKRDQPLLVSSVESARVIVQRLRDEANQRKNGTTTHTSIPAIDAAAVSERIWDALPQPKEEFSDWGAVRISGDYRTLIMSDIHIPFYDKPSLLAALEMGRFRRVNLIILNGDTFDFYAISDWEKDPRKRKFKEELQACAEFLKTLRAAFPKARIVFKLGNHEERYERYMRKKAPELLDIPNFALESVLEFENLGIEKIGEMRPILLGKLFVLHGHEYKFSIQNPVNPARGLFLRAKTLALCGHFHQSSHHSERNLQQSVISTWSAGCLCNLHPEFMPLNNWVNGHTIVNVAQQGEFEVENYRTIDGVSYR